MGLARDGGLFTPEALPRLPENAIQNMLPMNYQQRAVYVMSLFLDDFSREELEKYASLAYSKEKFDDDRIAPLRQVDGNTWALELWHGPTSAFKDMALQMLPHLLTASLTKTNEEKTVCILVATSGDTGKAALEGFKDVERTRILVFYPENGVSQVQKLQMRTQEGENVGVCAIVGNFDDAQTGVKTLFSDEALREELAQRGYFLSSANSINWGRVLPQVVYYISAYCDLVNAGAVKLGDKMNVCVPTGNFGNILACFYAKEMGLPVERLICASNANNVLTEFLTTGRYDRNRTFYTTTSPSMDILISSNLERLLFQLSGQDAQQVKGYMSALNQTGTYQVGEELLSKIKAHFSAGCCDDAGTQATIGAMMKEHGYLIDTHTAVAFHVLEDYRKETGDQTPTVVASTASPFKFCDAVLHALGVEQVRPGVDALDQLTEVTGIAGPTPLTSLRTKTPRFDGSVEKTQLLETVKEFLQ
jgi:threonine synthase